MGKAMKALEKAWVSLQITVDKVHDSAAWEVLSEDTRTQLLIDVKEMSSALGHAKNEASTDGVRNGRRPRSEGHEHVRPDARQLVLKPVQKRQAVEVDPKAQARAKLDPAAQRERSAARRKVSRKGGARRGRR